MKLSKITAVVITVCMLLSLITCTASASAEETNSQNKLSQDLVDAINERPDDYISVYLWLEPCTNESEIDRIVAEKYPSANADDYLMYYRKEFSDAVGTYVQKFIDDNADLLDEVLFQSAYSTFIIAKTTKEKIYKLAELNAVESISYYDDTIAEIEAEECNNLYENAFIDWSVSQNGSRCFTNGYLYKELYNHFNGDEVDWVLVEAKYLMEEPTVETWIHIGGRNIMSGSLCAPFKCGYGIYDVRENAFYDLDEFSADYSKYDGLMGALQTLRIGAVTDDVNLDEVVNVKDVTHIQRIVVEEENLNTTTLQKKLADINGDEKIDVKDATALQTVIVNS